MSDHSDNSMPSGFRESPEASARAIRDEMARLRNRISEESDTIATQTRQALDWKRQIALHPVAAASVAVLIGYWIVPRRKNRSVHNQSVHNQLHEIHQLLDKNGSHGSAPSTSIVRTLAMAAGTVLLRRVAGSAMQSLGSRIFSADPRSSDQRQNQAGSIHGELDDYRSHQYAPEERGEGHE